MEVAAKIAPQHPRRIPTLVLEPQLLGKSIAPHSPPVNQQCWLMEITSALQACCMLARTSERQYVGNREMQGDLVKDLVW
jgi:hypothetical protein